MRFVTRAEWGARAPRGRSGIGDVLGVTVHWGGGHLGDHSHARCHAIIRSWQRHHMDGNGWSDLGYNAVACHHGYVFEGRGIGIRGAHAGASDIGGNSRWYGLCAMVGPGDTITAELLDALADGIAWFRRSGAGRRVNGHRDHHATACPGDALYRWAHGGNVGGGSGTGTGGLLKRGSSGTAVRQWQEDLLEWNPAALPEFGADGDFGAETERWTRRFQRHAGTAVDGVVGPQTRHAMEEALEREPEEDDMPSPEEMWTHEWPYHGRDPIQASTYLSRTYVHALQAHQLLKGIAEKVGAPIEVDVDEAALAKEILAALPADLAQRIAREALDEAAARLAG